MHLQNKVALVTGINNDVGRITAIAMAQAGAKVAIADEDEVRGEAIVKLICQSGGEAFFHGTDITIERDVIELVEAVVCRYDSLDIAFNNASFEVDYLPIAQQSEDFVARLIDFNLNGTWTCIKQEIRQMLLQSGGVIINNVIEQMVVLDVPCIGQTKRRLKPLPKLLRWNMRLTIFASMRSLLVFCKRRQNLLQELKKVVKDLQALYLCL
ncbi:MAG: SDR family NAD(P)-dependent oxidoreductase [Cyanobacteria bacterium J06635_13]